jgi:hypothetical protein
MPGFKSIKKAVAKAADQTKTVVAKVPEQAQAVVTKAVDQAQAVVATVAKQTVEVGKIAIEQATTLVSNTTETVKDKATDEATRYYDKTKEKVATEAERVSDKLTESAKSEFERVKAKDAKDKVAEVIGIGSDKTSSDDTVSSGTIIISGGTITTPFATNGGTISYDATTTSAAVALKIVNINEGSMTITPGAQLPGCPIVLTSEKAKLFLPAFNKEYRGPATITPTMLSELLASAAHEVPVVSALSASEAVAETASEAVAETALVNTTTSPANKM